MDASLIERDYYPLKLAAKELDCTEDDLKHLAANRNLRIHVLTGGQSSWVTLCFNEQHDKWVEFRQALPKICLVPFEYWARYEAGEKCRLNTLASIDSKNMPDGIGDIHYSAPFYDRTGKIIEFTQFVILHDELERLKQVAGTTTRQTKSEPNESEAVTEWKKTAREMGESWMNEQRKEGKDPSVDAIAKYVEAEFKRLDIRGKRGDYLDWQTFKKEALTGITGKKATGK